MTKTVPPKDKTETRQNIKNLIANENSTDDSKQYIEKVQNAQLSPRSISDRLKQPKLQQKMTEDARKAKSPEPVEIQNEDVVDRGRSPSLRSGGEFCYFDLSILLLFMLL